MHDSMKWWEGPALTASIVPAVEMISPQSSGGRGLLLPHPPTHLEWNWSNLECGRRGLPLSRHPPIVPAVELVQPFLRAVVGGACACALTASPDVPTVADVLPKKFNVAAEGTATLSAGVP